VSKNQSIEIVCRHIYKKTQNRPLFPDGDVHHTSAETETAVR